MPLRLRGFSLAEVLLALGILSIAILAVAPLGVRVVQSLHQGETSDVALFHAASHVLESARIHIQANENGFATLETTFNGRSFAFDRDGIPLESGVGEITCAAWARGDALPPGTGDRLIWVAVRAMRTGYPDTTFDLATFLAAAPPREHMVFSGFLREEGTGKAKWDDYWGAYYGALYGRQQGAAYKAGLIPPDTYPMPADPSGPANPPTAPTPVPWGWR